ncbi:hypothetical protein KO02_21665 [Sphingobacterium sp. ML3W]|uniref:hypothetical protein n=1 Tax=Sphingobacterium sp. ML3W TaxID=1538644 RepID=UPI0004F62033|nr:hypothetical protein [Sphingobacterium sp. ML3W]AIM39010.1 hypothetical protein KO02_21665 [Sphingobacterium sp. ML3W]
MQNTCYRESYALSSGKEMSSLLSENRVSIIKKPIMITQLPVRNFKLPSLDPLKRLYSGDATYIQNKRPKERYYSYLTPSKAGDSSYTAVVRDDGQDVLRILLAHMAIYECYLFALGLPLSFPAEQIIVHGEDKAKFIPVRTTGVRSRSSEIQRYDYELTVPADTEREEYQQRILNDLNDEFQLHVRVEKLSIVKESRQVITKNGISVELIWQEQPMMIMKSKPNVSTVSVSNRRAVQI